MQKKCAGQNLTFPGSELAPESTLPRQRPARSIIQIPATSPRQESQTGVSDSGIRQESETRVPDISPRQESQKPGADSSRHRWPVSDSSHRHQSQTAVADLSHARHLITGQATPSRPGPTRYDTAQDGGSPHRLIKSPLFSCGDEHAAPVA